MSKWIRGLLFVLLIFVVPACSQQTKEKGPEEDKSITVPKMVLVPKGGNGYLSVSIDREVLENTVIMEIVDLPKGLKAINKDKQEGKTEEERKKGEKKSGIKWINERKVELAPKVGAYTFLLLAEQDMQAKKDYEIKVVVTEVKRTEFDGDVLLEFSKPKMADNIIGGRKVSKIILTPPDGEPETVMLTEKKSFKINSKNARITLVTESKESKEKVTKLEIRDYTVSGFGLVVMLISVLSVLSLVSFCLYRVMTLPPTEEESIKGPLEIDTGDTKDAD